MSIVKFLLLSQFAWQNISTRTDGEDQQIVSTHYSPGPSYATNRGAVSSYKGYDIH